MARLLLVQPCQRLHLLVHSRKHPSFAGEPGFWGPCLHIGARPHSRVREHNRLARFLHQFSAGEGNRCRSSRRSVGQARSALHVRGLRKQGTARTKFHPCVDLRVCRKHLARSWESALDAESGRHSCVFQSSTSRCSPRNAWAKCERYLASMFRRRQFVRALHLHWRAFRAVFNDCPPSTATRFTPKSQQSV